MIISVRPPAVAGRFYPGTAAELAATVDDLLAGAAAALAVTAAPVPGQPVGYVVPHAGYRFSGPTAARAYVLLRRDAGQLARVVLLGPAHHMALRGCAVPAAGSWRTPLGDVPVDVLGVSVLARAGTGLVAVDDWPHAPEHALEVQLPLLQRIMPAGVPVPPILPIAVGQCPPAGVADILDIALGVGPHSIRDGAVAPGSVVLCSTDLSHYLDQDTARRQDERTLRAVLDLADDRIAVRDACGVYALRGLVAWARRHHLRARLLHQSTSADTTGEATRVVGYAALAICGQRSAGQ